MRYQKMINMKKKLNKGADATVVEAPATAKKTKKTSNKATTTKKKKVEEPAAELPKAKKAKLDDANAASVTKKAITEKKDLKYIYPKEADDIPKRKAFRAEVRRKIAAFEKELGKLQYSKLEEDQELFEKKSEQYHKYRIKVLVQPEN